MDSPTNVLFFVPLRLPPFSSGSMCFLLFFDNWICFYIHELFPISASSSLEQRTSPRLYVKEAWPPVEAPVVRNGKVVGFHTFFCNMPDMSERKFAIDMAGFAVRLSYLVRGGKGVTGRRRGVALYLNLHPHIVASRATRHSDFITSQRLNDDP